MTNSACLPSTTYLAPLIFWPSTVVPIFVFRSSIVSLERLVRWWAWPSGTSSTVMVRCLREMVLWEMASWPAAGVSAERKQRVVHHVRSAAVLPKRYVLPGLNQRRRPGYTLAERGRMGGRGSACLQKPPHSPEATLRGPRAAAERIEEGGYYS